MALIVVGVFQSIDGTSQGVQTRNGALFYMIVSQAFVAVQNIILVFPDERPVFLREVNNNMYDVSSYFFAKVFSEFPMNILCPILYGIIIYYSIGLSTENWYTMPLFCNISIFNLINSLVIILILTNLASGSYALVMGVTIADK